MKNTISNKTIVELSNGMCAAPSQDKVKDAFEGYRSAKNCWDSMRRTVCRCLVHAMSESGNQYSLSDLSAYSGVSIPGVRGYLEKLIRSREYAGKGMPFYARENLDNFIIHKESRVVCDKWVKIGEDGEPMWDCVTNSNHIVTFYWVTRK